MGMAIFVGLVVPTWLEKNPDAIQTGMCRIATSFPYCTLDRVCDEGGGRRGK